MSWKSFVSAGLLCVLASPVFAAPTMQVVKGGTQATGHLNTAGNWVWSVQLAPSDSPLPTGGTPLAAELGFRETTNAELLGATNPSTIGSGTGFDTNNPGNDIYATGVSGDWEVYVDTDPGAGTNMRPTGLQTNLPTDEVFSALGSQIYTTTGMKDYISIEVQGPCVDTGPGSSCDASGDRLTTTIQTLGAYGGNGRISELNAAGTTSYNTDTYNVGGSRTAKKGDANLDGSVDLATDRNTVLANLGSPTTPWYNGDFNDDGSIDLATDSNIVLANLGTGAGGGSGGGSAIPEPASVALVGLAALALAGLRGRRK